MYNRYSKKPDDQLLKGLNPLDVCRLYFYAEDKKNYETMYALYIHDEKYLVPTKEEFLMDVKNDKVSRVNDEKLIQTVVKENNGTVVAEVTNNTLDDLNKGYITNITIFSDGTTFIPRYNKDATSNLVTIKAKLDQETIKYITDYYNSKKK